MKLMVAIFVLGCLVLPVLDSHAGIYRWEDENGVVHFTNCPRDARFKLHIRESTEDPVEEKQGVTAVPEADKNQFDPLILEASRRHDVDFALIKAIIRAESGFNPLAVSRKGAKGLMQLMPATARRMNVQNIFNPRENIEGGVRYFKYLLSLFNNDLRLSLAAYNAGEQIVSDLRTIPPYRETIDYVRKVIHYYQSYRL